ncbi:MAG: chemotaxis protein CheW [Acidimicrobiia bacterium]
MTITVVSLCTFRLGELRVGVDVTQVQEVMRDQQATKVPLVPDVIHGLINLRGEIVTTIDLRRRLGLPAREDSASPMNVVIRTPDGPVALVVDEIDDVIDADEHLFELPPPTLHGVRREFVTGVFKLEHALLLVLDLERVLDHTSLYEQAEVPA